MAQKPSINQDFKLTTGIGKESGKPWFMLTVEIGKYKNNDPLFLTEIEYDYLLAMKQLASVTSDPLTLDK